eukprot:evm.model.scf_1841EXC.2 EVM.evm.TU.scf_1841EXC.2   scf_1841EXC:12263-15257(+)
MAEVSLLSCGRPLTRVFSWRASKLPCTFLQPHPLRRAQRLGSENGSNGLATHLTAATSSQPTATTPLTPSFPVGAYVIRPATPEDIEPIAQLLDHAFSSFYGPLGAPSVFPESRDPVDVPELVTKGKTLRDGIEQFVAVSVDNDGNEVEVVGVNGVDLRDHVAGIGVLAAKPNSGCRGVGRALMKKAIELAENDKKETIALLVDSWALGAFALYSSLGFEVAEPMAVVEGVIGEKAAEEALAWAEGEGLEIRRMGEGDVEGCAELFSRCFGVGRGVGIRDSQEAPTGATALVAVRRRGGEAGGTGAQEEVVGYTTMLSMGGHYLAENEQVLKALVAHGSQMVAAGGGLPGMGFSMNVLTESNPGFLRWALGAGLRVQRHVMFMTRGRQIERAPGVAYCPDGFY